MLAIITETHFTKYFNEYRVTIFLETNRSDITVHVGVPVLIKTLIQYQSLPDFCKDYLQLCALIVKLKNIPITAFLFQS